MSKDTYYFSHDAGARNDPRILVIRSSYGLAGYGAFWMLLEMMRESVSYKIESKPIYLKSYAKHIGCDAEWLRKLIDDLIDIDLFAEEDDFLFSQTMLDRMAVIDEKRRKNTEAAHIRWRNRPRESVSNATAMHTHTSEGDKQKKKQEPNIPFETFWGLYDYKVGSKQKARSSWLKLKDDERAAILDHIPQYQAAKEEAGISLEYPTTYLNQRHFEIDPSELTKHNNNGKQRNTGKSRAEQRIDRIAKLGTGSE